jgi:hypothetical protein
MDIVMLENQIDQAYSSQELRDVYDFFFQPFIDINPGLFREISLDPRPLSRVSIPKKELVRLVAAVFLNPSILKRWADMLPELAYQALHIVTWEGEQDSIELSRRIGSPILEETIGGKGSSQKKLRKPFALFQVTFFKSFWGAEGNCVYASLPQVMSQSLKTIFSEPPGLKLTGVDSVVDCPTAFEDRGRILEVLPVIIRFIQQGELELTQQGSPRSKSVNRLKEVCNLSEFYKGQHSLDLNTLRTRMIVSLLSSINLPVLTNDVGLFLKNLIKEYLKIPRYPHMWIFSHIKGLYHCRGKFNDQLHIGAWSLLNSLPEDQWVTVSQLKAFACLTGKNLAPVDKINADRYLYLTTEWRGWGNKKQYLTPGRFETALVDPSLKAGLFLFASFGLLDLAYRQPENHQITTTGKPYLTVFDGLEAIRLNSLGAYLAGKRVDFGYSPEQVGDVLLELDPDRLFISYSRTDPLAEISLERFASRISLTRFKVNTRSFLKGCRSRTDLTNKIQLFKEEVCEVLPEKWQIFFNQLGDRMGVLTPADELLVFKLAPGNSELADVIATDRILKQFILKAEGKHLLVKSADLEKLKNRLEELGYLM